MPPFRRGLGGYPPDGRGANEIGAVRTARDTSSTMRCVDALRQGARLQRQLCPTSGAAWIPRHSRAHSHCGVTACRLDRIFWLTNETKNGPWWWPGPRGGMSAGDGGDLCDISGPPGTKMSLTSPKRSGCSREPVPMTSAETKPLAVGWIISETPGLSGRGGGVLLRHAEARDRWLRCATRHAVAHDRWCCTAVADPDAGC